MRYQCQQLQCIHLHKRQDCCWLPPWIMTNRDELTKYDLSLKYQQIIKRFLLYLNNTSSPTETNSNDFSLMVIILLVHVELPVFLFDDWNIVKGFWCNEIFIDSTENQFTSLFPFRNIPKKNIIITKRKKIRDYVSQK